MARPLSSDPDAQLLAARGLFDLANAQVELAYRHVGEMKGWTEAAENCLDRAAKVAQVGALAAQLAQVTMLHDMGDPGEPSEELLAAVRDVQRRAEENGSAWDGPETRDG